MQHNEPTNMPATYALNESGTMRKTKNYDTISLAVLIVLPTAIWSYGVVTAETPLPNWACFGYGCVMLLTGAAVTIVVIFLKTIPIFLCISKDGLVGEGRNGEKYVLLWEQVTSFSNGASVMTLWCGITPYRLVWRYACTPDRKDDLNKIILGYLEERRGQNRQSHLIELPEKAS